MGANYGGVELKEYTFKTDEEKQVNDIKLHKSFSYNLKWYLKPFRGPVF